MLKKIAISSLLSLLILFTFSCKNEKKTTEKINEISAKKYSFVEKTTKMEFTAYKTTKKLPVKGVFTKITIKNPKTASSVIEAINELSFSIPVNSIQTKNTDRDVKIIKSFFGEMKETTHLTGTVSMNNSENHIVLKMNGISSKLPIKYNVKDQIVTIEGIINLDNWKAKAAISALNLVCKDLHKGEDGISQTWNEVAIKIVTALKVEN